MIYLSPFLFILSLSAFPIYDDYLLAENEFPHETGNWQEEMRYDPAQQYNPAQVNLEEMAQDFVIGAKQIEVPGYPGSFNPSIIRWKGSLLLSFRTRAPITKNTNETNGIGLVWLDEKFNPIGPPQILSISYPEELVISKQQDPRLIQIEERLLIVYNNVIDPLVHPELRRMYYLELVYDGNYFHPQTPQVIIDYPYKLDYRQEKNWVPFNYNDQLLLGYSIAPHTIFSPISNTARCELFSESKTSLNWDWGTLRGGTPALEIDGQYLAFFHSCMNLPTLHSKGKNMLHYFMGAYTFSSSPPFKITAISKEPIIGETFYSGPAYKTWKPLRVVFPGGYVFDEENIWVVFGKQDFEMWVVQLDKKKLFESLIH